MQKNKVDLSYSILWNGVESELPDTQYQKKLTNFSIKFKDVTEILLTKFDNFIKRSEIKGIKKFYLDFFYKNSIYPFYVGYLKNSGESAKSDKRLQIYSDTPNFIKNKKYYGIGFMPTGDDEIVVIVEMSQYVENKISSISSNFSSLWVNYEKIKEAYYNRKLVIETEPDKIRYIFRKSDSTSLKLTLDFLFPEIPFKGNDLKLPPPPIPQITTLEKLPRDHKLREESIIRANFRCELCGRDNTFMAKDSKWYFEVHHLIPFNITNQKMFKFSLDHLSNLVCLCPECHRKVHFAELKEQVRSLEKLLNLRKEIFENYAIKDLEHLLQLYTSEE